MKQKEEKKTFERRITELETCKKSERRISLDLLASWRWIAFCTTMLSRKSRRSRQISGIEYRSREKSINRVLDCWTARISVLGPGVGGRLQNAEKLARVVAGEKHTNLEQRAGCWCNDLASEGIFFSPRFMCRVRKAHKINIRKGSLRLKSEKATTTTKKVTRRLSIVVFVVVVFINDFHLKYNKPRGCVTFLSIGFCSRR